MARQDRERRKDRERQRAGEEEALARRWRETGDLAAAERLTEIRSARGDPCADCGGPADDDYDVVRSGLLTYGPGPVCEPCWEARRRLAQDESYMDSDDVYVYQAAMLCAECGLAARRELERAGKAPKPSDVVVSESSYDSDDYPKGPHPDGGGESDSPEHCDLGEACLNALVLDGRKYGAWLRNALTSEGERMVRESLRDHPTPLSLWWAELYDIELPGELAEEEFVCSRCERPARWYGDESCGACRERFCIGCTPAPDGHPGYHRCWDEEDEEGEEDEDAPPTSNPRERDQRSLDREAARGDARAKAKAMALRARSGRLDMTRLRAAAALGHGVAIEALEELGEPAPLHVEDDAPRRVGGQRDLLRGERIEPFVSMLGARGMAAWMADALDRSIDDGVDDVEDVVSQASRILREFADAGKFDPDRVEKASTDVHLALEVYAPRGTASRALADAAFSLLVPLKYAKEAGIGPDWMSVSPTLMAIHAKGAASSVANAAWRRIPPKGRSTPEREAAKVAEERWLLSRLAAYLVGDIVLPGDSVSATDASMDAERLREIDEKREARRLEIDRLIDDHFRRPEP